MVRVRVRMLVGRQGPGACCGRRSSSSGASPAALLLLLLLLLLLRGGTSVRLVQVGLSGQQRVQVNVHDAEALVPKGDGGTRPVRLRLKLKLLLLLQLQLLLLLAVVHDPDQ